MGEVAIVGQDQQTLGVGVQAADVKKPLVPAFSEQIGNCAPAFRIVHCGDDTPRLVQRQVSVPARRRDAGAVDPNDIAFRIDPSALLEDDLRVDLDTSLADQDFAGATGSDAGLGEDFLKSYALCRVGH
jgi:hypothetical protein